MSPIFRNITMIYIIVLALVAGAVNLSRILKIYLIFWDRADMLSLKILSRYQEGMIMTQNFVLILWRDIGLFWLLFCMRATSTRWGREICGLYSSIFSCSYWFDVLILLSTGDVVALQALLRRGYQNRGVYSSLHKGSPDVEDFLFCYYIS